MADQARYLLETYVPGWRPGGVRENRTNLPHRWRAVASGDDWASLAATARHFARCGVRARIVECDTGHTTGFETGGTIYGGPRVREGQS